jgi:cell wall-associated NlpC family hydrolase
MKATPASVVAEARTWIDTPYQHQQEAKGVVCDCRGLVMGVGKRCGLLDPDFEINGYSTHPDGVTMLELCDRYLDRIARAAMRPSDILVVRYGKHPQHMGILADYKYGGLSLIHSLASMGGVKEHRLMFHESMVYVQAYRFRGID